MPCIVLTGHPCSGKSTLAAKIRERATRPDSRFAEVIDRVVIINEETACPGWTKNQCYATALAEKKTRASLKSAFDRAVGVVDDDSGETANNNRSALIILDSMNYIKGFRYELHCISKAASVQHCVLWVLNRHDTIKELNKRRQMKAEEETQSGRLETELDADGSRAKTGGPYDDSVMDELILRFEPPDERNRWDKPLYTIECSTMFPGVAVARDAGGERKSDVLKRSVYNMHALSKTIDGSEPSSPEIKSKSAMRRPKKSAFSRKKAPTPKPVPKEVASGDVATQGEPSEPQGSNHKPSNLESLDDQIDAILESLLFHVKPLSQGASTKLHLAGA